MRRRIGIILLMSIVIACAGCGGYYAGYGSYYDYPYGYDDDYYYPGSYYFFRGTGERHEGHEMREGGERHEERRGREQKR